MRSLPIILAWRLWKQNALDMVKSVPFVERAARLPDEVCPRYPTGALEEKLRIFALDAGRGDYRID